MCQKICSVTLGSKQQSGLLTAVSVNGQEQGLASYGCSRILQWLLATAKASHGIETRIGNLRGAAGSLSICQTIQLLLESSKPCITAAPLPAVTVHAEVS